MSSNLRTQKTAIFTPQLKRNLTQHQSLRTTSKLSPNLLLQSKQRTISSFQISQCHMSKGKKEEQLQTRDGSQQSLSGELNQQLQEGLQEIVQINDMFKQLIGEDLKLASKRKERKVYSHTYQEKKSYGDIWIDQPREIPKQVFELNQKIAKKGEQKINCLQGFIEQLALFYYAVDNIVRFYDATTLGRESSCICQIQFKEKSLSALFGIQVFQIGMPYFQYKKSVMVFLHPYLAEMYQLNFNIGLQSHQKELKIKALLSFPLPQQTPTQLYHSQKGYIYCTDDNGKVYQIDCRQHYWNVGKKDLLTKKIRESPVVSLKNSTKYLASSLKAFALHVKNYTLSFWKNKLIKTWLLFDEQLEIMVVLIKKQRREQAKETNRFIHQFIVYKQKSNELLYTFQLQEHTGKYDQIMVFNKLYVDCSTKYNFMVLMQSGKRIVLDIQSDRLKKTSIIKPPPLNTQQTDSINKSNNVFSCCMQQDLMGQVVMTNHHHLILTKTIDQFTQKVTYLRLQPSDTSSIYIANNQPLGYKKTRILLSEQSKLKPQNLPQFTRQVFYRPYQLYYSTDQIVQRIIVLRPIDIFYSLFTILSQNMPQLFKSINTIMPQVDSLNLLSFCCQVLVDSQGQYLISRQLQDKARSGWNSKGRVDWQMIEYKRFKDIDNNERSKLIEVMIDIAMKAKFTQKQSKQRYVVKGILNYYAKLLKPIYLASINILSSQICKITLSSLRQLNNLLLLIEKSLRNEGKSYLSKLLKWTNRLYQFVMFINNVPNLPNISLDHCIVQEIDLFHEHLFKFLIRECREQIFGQIKKMLPIFITTPFTRMYKLYLQVSEIKDASKILQSCKSYGRIPDYFVDYLVKVKSIPQAVLLKETKPSLAIVGKESKAAYTSKMNEFYQMRSNLYQKQQILLNASFLLHKQSPDKLPTLNIKRQQQRVKRLMGQLKLQALIIQVYHSRVIDNKSLWINILSKYMPNSALQPQERQVIQRLNTCLLDRNFLSSIIADLDDSFLKVMYAYYFNPHSFQSVFFTMAEEILKNHQHSISELNDAFKEQLHFMICKAKLTFTFEQIAIILDTFINLLLKSQELQTFLGKPEKFVQKKLFWPLIYCAEIGLDIDKLYDWGIKKLSQFDKGDKSYIYTALCCCYLVKDFLPQKRQDLLGIMKCQQQQYIYLKQIYSLMLS